MRTGSDGALTLKKATHLQEPETQTRGKKGLTGALEGKLPLLIIFAVLYGLVFINYIDISSSGLSYGYHLWLVLMYFLPFIGFSIFNLKNWKFTIGLGLIASLMNDVFYNFIRYLIGYHINLSSYYNRWLIPQNAMLFHLNLGFAVIPVQSWMMASSIYLRIAATCVLLKGWDIPMRNMQIASYLSLKRQKIGNLNRASDKQPSALSSSFSSYRQAAET